MQAIPRYTYNKDNAAEGAVLMSEGHCCDILGLLLLGKRGMGVLLSIARNYYIILCTNRLPQQSNTKASNATIT